MYQSKEASLTEFCFNIFGQPKGQGRPRARMNGFHASVYKDKQSRFYETFIADTILRNNSKAIYFTHDDYKSGLELEIDCYFSVPSSYSKKKQNDCFAGLISHTKKPDLDNVVKAVLDGITLSGLWDDDSIVVSINATKKYTQDKPYVAVKIKGEKSI